MPRSITVGINGLAQVQMRNALGELQKGVTDCLFNTAGLAIGSSSKKAVKVVNTVYALINGAVVKKTTAEKALAGTITNAKFNVYVLSLSADGTLNIAMGTEGATLGAVVLPAILASDVMLGMVIVNPTGTGNFVGGTTDLDDATVVPNAVYINSPFGGININAMNIGEIE